MHLPTMSGSEKPIFFIASTEGSQAVEGSDFKVGLNVYVKAEQTKIPVWPLPGELDQQANRSTVSQKDLLR